jgi:hypothetical protein
MALTREQLLEVLARGENEGPAARAWVVFRCGHERLATLVLDCLVRREDVTINLIREIFGSWADVVRIVDFRVDPNKSKVHKESISIHASFELKTKDTAMRPITSKWLRDLP